MSSNQYTYQRPSTIATRSLISDTKPNEISSTSSNDAHATEQHNHPISTATKSDNYTQAVAAAQSDRPGLDRQQSWSLSDKKRQMAEQMLQGSQGHNAQGYASTSS